MDVATTRREGCRPIPLSRWRDGRRVGVGLRGSISVIFIVGAGGSIVNLLTIRWRFLLNGADIVKANIFINYIAGAAD